MVNTSLLFGLKLRHAFAGVLLVFGATTSASATVISYAHAFDNSPGGGYRDYGTLNGNRSSASVTTDFSRAAASAQYGILKAFSATGVGGDSASSSYVSATFMDRLTLNKAGLSGQRGLVTFAYAIDYDAWVAVTGGGFSNGSVSFTASTGYYYDWYMDHRNSWDSSYTMYEQNSPDGTKGRTYNVPRMSMLYHTAEVVWGNAFETEFEITISTGAGAPTNGSAAYTFDAANSAYWGGIVSATVDGVEISDYEITSQSGTDYSYSFVPTAEVPEPGSLSILAIGFAGLGAQRLRRRLNNLSPARP